MPNAEFELPYEGVKEMLLPDIDNIELITEVIPKIFAELPNPKTKK